MTSHSFGALTPVETVETHHSGGMNSTENPKNRLKLLSCRYCTKRFRRLEHVQRHERTHTKETPFKCACGKSFSRRDLLRRHQKSAHNNETGDIENVSAPDNQAEVQTGANPLPAVAGPGDSSQDSCLPQVSNLLQQGTTIRSLGPFANPAAHRASFNEASQYQPSFGEHYARNGRISLSAERCQETQLSDETLRQEINRTAGNTEINFLEAYGHLDSYNAFLDDFDFSSYFLPQDFGVNPAQQAAWYMPMQLGENLPDRAEPLARVETSAEAHGGQVGTFSRFGSPLPSLQPEPGGQIRLIANSTENTSKSRPCWKISGPEYHHILAKLQDFSSVMPKNFVPPSRHTMSRFLEGCIKGLYEHLPFLHIPTFSVRNATPELLLAMAAVGAQFRFEIHRGNILFYAAKAVVLEQVHRRSSKDALEILGRPPSLLASTSTSPISPGNLSSSGNPNTRSHEDAHRTGRAQTGEELVDEKELRLQTMQALLSIMVMGTWGPRQLVKEAISLQSLLTVLAHEDGLSETEDADLATTSSERSRWLSWIRWESHKRTKLMVYCFLNLQCVAYHLPPLILTSEIDCRLPMSAEEWNAETAQKWDQARCSTDIVATSFRESYESLFQNRGTRLTKAPLSSLGLYTLIFALLQRIFFLRQAFTGSRRGTIHNTLRSEDIDDLGRAVQCWQACWERSPESSVEPQSAAGPVAFNSTALLRLAWIRLHFDLGPCRNLATRDPVVIAAAFRNSPPLQRSPRLTQTILQAAHALSVPVRMGINFVAKTQTISWSVQHSLSNLECAIFVSKWLEDIALTASVQALTTEEQTLISMMKSMLEETGFFEDEAVNGIPYVQTQPKKTRQLATAVARLWAEIFKGTHVFDVVNTIGASLNIYAELLESSLASDG